MLQRIALAVLLALSALPARAAFQYPPIGPRASAMGGAALALSQDSSAIFMNPAGIARLGSKDVYFMYNKLYAGLDGVGNIGEGLMTFGFPTRFGTFAAGMGGFTASGLKQEMTFAMSYARPFLNNRLQAGATVKHLYHKYSPSGEAAAADPVFSNGTSRGAISFDLGMVATVADPLKLGVAVRNINRPDVGLASEDRVPRDFQVGLAYDIGGIGLKTTSDLVYRNTGSDTGGTRVLPAFGLEKAVYGNKACFRIGANPLEFTGGVGFNLGSVGIDYALVLKRNLIADNAGSHQIGVHFQFGGPRK